MGLSTEFSETASGHGSFVHAAMARVYFIFSPMKLDTRFMIVIINR